MNPYKRPGRFLTASRRAEDFGVGLPRPSLGTACSCARNEYPIKISFSTRFREL